MTTAGDAETATSEVTQTTEIDAIYMNIQSHQIKCSQTTAMESIPNLIFSCYQHSTYYPDLYYSDISDSVYSETLPDKEIPSLKS